MSYIEQIEKIFKENTLRLRERITHDQMHKSKFEIQEYHEKRMALKVGEFSRETNRILYEQSFGEEDKTLQLECVVLHPDTVEKIMSLLGVKYERF